MFICGMTSCGVCHRRTYSPVFAGSGGSPANESWKPKAARTIRTVDSSVRGNVRCESLLCRKQRRAGKKRAPESWKSSVQSLASRVQRRETETIRGRTEILFAEMLPFSSLDSQLWTLSFVLAGKMSVGSFVPLGQPINGVGGFAGATPLTKCPRRAHEPVVRHCETGVSSPPNKGNA